MIIKDNYKIKQGWDISIKDFLDLYHCCENVLSKESTGSLWQNIMIALKSRFGCIVIRTLDNKFVGFFSFICLSDIGYQKIKSATARDVDLKNSDVKRPKKNYRNHFCLSAIAIYEQYRNYKTLKLVNELMYQKLIDLAHQKYYTNTVIAEGVTPEGRRLCEINNFIKVLTVNENESIYELTENELRNSHLILGKELYNVHDQVFHFDKGEVNEN